MSSLIELPDELTLNDLRDKAKAAFGPIMHIRKTLLANILNELEKFLTFYSYLSYLDMARVDRIHGVERLAELGTTLVVPVPPLIQEAVINYENAFGDFKQIFVFNKYAKADLSIIADRLQAVTTNGYIAWRSDSWEAANRV